MNVDRNGMQPPKLRSLIRCDHLFVCDLESVGHEILPEDDEVRAAASARRRHEQSLVSEPIHSRTNGSARYVIDTGEFIVRDAEPGKKIGRSEIDYVLQ